MISIPSSDIPPPSQAETVSEVVKQIQGKVNSISSDVTLLLQKNYNSYDKEWKKQIQSNDPTALKKDIAKAEKNGYTELMEKQNQTICELKQKNTKLCQELSNFRISYCQMKKDLENKGKQNNQLEMQLRSAKNNLTGLEKTTSDLNKALLTSKDHNNTLSTTNQQLSKENKQLMEQNQWNGTLIANIVGQIQERQKDSKPGNNIPQSKRQSYISENLSHIISDILKQLRNKEASEEDFEHLFAGCDLKDSGAEKLKEKLPEIDLMIEKYPSQGHWGYIKEALVILGEKEEQIGDLIKKEKKQKREFSNILKRFRCGVEDRIMIQSRDKIMGDCGLDEFISQTSELINKCIRERHDMGQSQKQMKDLKKELQLKIKLDVNSIEKLGKEKEDLGQKIAELKNELQKSRQDNQSLGRKISQLQSNLRSEKLEYMRKKKEWEEQTEKLEINHGVKISSLNESIEAYKRELNQMAIDWSKQKETNKVNKQKLKNKITQLEGHVTSQKKKVEEKEREITSYVISSQALEAKIVEKRGEIRDLSDSLKMVENNLKTSNEKNQKLQKDLKASRDYGDEKDRIIIEKNNALRQKQGKLKTLLDKQGELTQTISQMEKDHKTQISNLKDDHRMKIIQIEKKSSEAIERLKKEHRLQVDTLKLRISQLEKEIERLKQEHKSQVNALKLRISQLEKEIERLKKEHRSQVDTLKLQISQLNTQISGMKEIHQNKCSQFEDYKLKVKEFQKGVNDIFKQISKTPYEFSVNNMDSRLFTEVVGQFQKVKRQRYLSESNIFQSLSESQKQFIQREICTFSKMQIKGSKTLLKITPNMDSVHWTEVIGHKNLLILIRMKNTKLVGGFSVEEYSKDPIRPTQQGNGCLLSISDKTRYNLKKDAKNILNYGTFALSIGNNDVKIFQDGEVSSIFGKLHGSFDSKGKKAADLIGASEGEKYYCELAQFHQIIFE